MIDILALISSILFTPAFSISFFYETGVNSPLPLYFFLTTVKVRLYLLRKSPPFP